MRLAGGTSVNYLSKHIINVVLRFELGSSGRLTPADIFNFGVELIEAGGGVN